MVTYSSYAWVNSQLRRPSLTLGRLSSIYRQQLSMPLIPIPIPVPNPIRGCCICIMSIICCSIMFIGCCCILAIPTPNIWFILFLWAIITFKWSRGFIGFIWRAWFISEIFMLDIWLIWGMPILLPIISDVLWLALAQRGLVPPLGNLSALTLPVRVLERLLRRPVPSNIASLPPWDTLPLANPSAAPSLTLPVRKLERLLRRPVPSSIASLPPWDTLPLANPSAAPSLTLPVRKLERLLRRPVPSSIASLPPWDTLPLANPSAAPSLTLPVLKLERLLRSPLRRFLRSLCSSKLCSSVTLLLKRQTLVFASGIPPLLRLLAWGPLDLPRLWSLLPWGMET